MIDDTIKTAIASQEMESYYDDGYSDDTDTDDDETEIDEGSFNDEVEEESEQDGDF